MAEQNEFGGDVREQVREKYAAAARAVTASSGGGCCGPAPIALEAVGAIVPAADSASRAEATARSTGTSGGPSRASSDWTSSGVRRS